MSGVYRGKREMRMRFHAIRLLTLTVSVIALVAAVATGAADASSRNAHRHHVRQNRGFSNSWNAGEIRPAASSWSRGGDVCPGNARAIDCKIWPPPIIDDPDRRNGSGDGM